MDDIDGVDGVVRPDDCDHEDSSVHAVDCLKSSTPLVPRKFPDFGESHKTGNGSPSAPDFTGNSSKSGSFQRKTTSPLLQRPPL
jgi:hypothetical protein